MCGVHRIGSMSMGMRIMRHAAGCSNRGGGVLRDVITIEGTHSIGGAVESAEGNDGRWV